MSDPPFPPTVSATALAARVYAASLPAAVLAEAARADLIVIESTAAVALFDVLRRAAPQARFVYCASDRLVPNGMSRVLQAILDRTAPGMAEAMRSVSSGLEERRTSTLMAPPSRARTRCR